MMTNDSRLQHRFVQAIDEVVPPAPWLETQVVEALQRHPRSRRRALRMGAFRGFRSRYRLAAGLVALLIAVATMAAWLMSSHLQSTTVPGGSQVGPPALRLAATVKVGDHPGAIAAPAGSVWVGNLGNATVSRIDPLTSRVIATISTGASGMAADDSTVWVTDELKSTLIRIDPQTNRVVATIPVAPGPHGVALGEGAVWIASFGAGGQITRVDPESNRVVATISLPGAVVQRVAIGYGSVWVPSGDGRLFRIDPKTNRIAAIISIPQYALDATVGEGAVWVDINPQLAGGSSPGSVVRVDPTSNRVVATIRVGHNPNGIAAGAGAVFVGNQDDGTLTEIDPRTNSVVGRPLAVGKGPAGVAVGATAVWVANNIDGTVARVDFSS